MLGSMTFRVSCTRVETERGTLPVRMMKDLGALVEVAALLFGPLRWVRVFLRRLTIVTDVYWAPDAAGNRDEESDGMVSIFTARVLSANKR